MIVCDRCMGTDCSKNQIVFEKWDKGKTASRAVLEIPMDLCEKCLSELLKEFGKFKHKFMDLKGWNERHTSDVEG